MQTFGALVFFCINTWAKVDDGFSDSASLSLTGLDAESPCVEDSVGGTSGGVGLASTGAEATAIKVYSLTF